MSNFSTFFKSFSILLYFMSHSVSSLPSNKLWNESSACLLNCTLSYMKMWLEVMQHDAVEKLEAVDAEHICRKFLKYSACVKVCNSPNSPFLKFEDFEKNCKDVNNGILTNLTCIRKNSANVRRKCMKEENNLLKAVDKTLYKQQKHYGYQTLLTKAHFAMPQ
ncbi:Shikimate dehydrogenase (NADP(+)) [Trichinella spiralis]|uniref:Shikimate dehydrogenase (NADP(+)) n=1 Tax=Trichinella spiralis TaxID=6334 RepID=A0ABR3KYP5_TRISP